MPWVGRTSFLLSFTIHQSYMYRLCQCPGSGEPHFYRCRPKKVRLTRILCQCPGSGEPHFYIRKTPKDIGQKCLCQCPGSGEPHFYKWQIILNLPSKCCVNALGRANLISILPPLRASVYAGFRPCFCRYFSEFSDKYTKRGVKVGKAWIVFIRVQSVEAFYTYDYT